MTQAPPIDLAEQVQWLVDRAAISDLIVNFARCLDVRDWEGYVENFAEDGVLELPFGTFEGRDTIAARATKGLDNFDATHHISANHAITIDGDAATSRSYLWVAHVPDASDRTRHGDAGGWYDHEYRRTPQGWRLTRVKLTVLWESGTDLPGR